MSRYYFDNGNYKINANEIQAEKEGIMNVYDYLCKNFSNINPKDHESIILDIVNDKMLNSTYFISSPTPFKSLSEVEKAFDDAYDDSFTKKRTYMVNSRNTHDAVKLFMREHPEAKEVYLNADSPLEQDRYIASINLKLHPEWLKAYPSLSDIDLSYENIIEKPYEKLLSHKTLDQIKEDEICSILQNNSRKVSVSRGDRAESVFKDILESSISDDIEKE